MLNKSLLCINLRTYAQILCLLLSTLVILTHLICSFAHQFHLRIVPSTHLNTLANLDYHFFGSRSHPQQSSQHLFSFHLSHPCQYLHFHIHFNNFSTNLISLYTANLTSYLKFFPATLFVEAPN